MKQKLIIKDTLISGSPTKWRCSSEFTSVKFLSCCNNNGYLSILCIGLIKYDSNVDECCCFGFLADKNSWRAWLPSSSNKTIKKILKKTGYRKYIAHKKKLLTWMKNFLCLTVTGAEGAVQLEMIDVV